MRKFIYLLFVLSICASCKSTKNTQHSQDKQIIDVPVITWDKQTLDIGQVKLGETKSVVFDFTNTGTKDLVIELVTACKCTTLDWPRHPVAPGSRGQVFVTYDSTDQAKGHLKKTVDVIANTEPIVVEAFFNVIVVD